MSTSKRSVRSTKPSCPNHGEPLEGIGFPIPRKGTGTCPISGVPFDFEADFDQHAVIKDKDGNLTKAPIWQMTGDERDR